ncbi:hypothetical protein AT730_20785 [Vibrio alginolyticus]|nr:hypothetical protein AT730_20785 [Vibrio alginolyticus]
MKVDLIECGACQAEISPLSEYCPKCGNPNDWKHPLIERFLKAPVLVEKAYKYTSTKTTLRGVVSKDISSWRENTVVGVTSCTFALLGFRCAVYVLLFLLAVLVMPIKCKDDVYFEYDVLNDSWKSNNNELFEPVRRYFSEHAS